MIDHHSFFGDVGLGEPPGMSGRSSARSSGRSSGGLHIESSSVASRGLTIRMGVAIFWREHVSRVSSTTSNPSPSSDAR